MDTGGNDLYGPCMGVPLTPTLNNDQRPAYTGGRELQRVVNRGGVHRECVQVAGWGRMREGVQEHVACLIGT